MFCLHIENSICQLLSYLSISMDVIIEVLCDSKTYVTCRFRVCLCLCGSSINLYLNYFSRQTETLGSVGPAHDPIRPMLGGCGPWSLQSFLHKAPSLFLSGSGFVA